MQDPSMFAFSHWAFGVTESCKQSHRFFVRPHPLCCLSIRHKPEDTRCHLVWLTVMVSLNLPGIFYWPLSCFHARPFVRSARRKRNGRSQSPRARMALKHGPGKWGLQKPVAGLAGQEACLVFPCIFDLSGPCRSKEHTFTSAPGAITRKIVGLL